MQTLINVVTCKGLKPLYRTSQISYGKGPEQLKLKAPEFYQHNFRTSKSPQTTYRT